MPCSYQHKRLNSPKLEIGSLHQHLFCRSSCFFSSSLATCSTLQHSSSHTHKLDCFKDFTAEQSKSIFLLHDVVLAPVTYFQRLFQSVTGTLPAIVGCFTSPRFCRNSGTSPHDYTSAVGSRPKATTPPPLPIFSGLLPIFPWRKQSGHKQHRS